MISRRTTARTPARASRVLQALPEPHARAADGRVAGPLPSTTRRTPLARREEREARAQFGDAYVRYETTTPAFFPRHHRRAEAVPPSPSPGVSQ